MSRVLVRIGAIVMCSVLSAGANLIVDGGFENGTNNWQFWGAGNIEAVSGWGWQHGGSSMVQMWTDAGLYQDFAVVPGSNYLISAYTCHANWDPILWGSTGRVGGVSLEWRDGSDQLISSPWQYTFGSDNQLAAEGNWVLANSGPQSAPAGAAVGRVVVNIWNDGTGSGRAFFDDVQVVGVIPEPAAVTLVGLGGLLLCAVRKKNRK